MPSLHSFSLPLPFFTQKRKSGDRFSILDGLSREKNESFLEIIYPTLDIKCQKEASTGKYAPSYSHWEKVILKRPFIKEWFILKHKCLFLDTSSVEIAYLCIVIRTR
jgi:hypothetical protein